MSSRKIHMPNNQTHLMLKTHSVAVCHYARNPMMAKLNFNKCSATSVMPVITRFQKKLLDTNGGTVWGGSPFVRVEWVTSVLLRRCACGLHMIVNYHIMHMVGRTVNMVVYYIPHYTSPTESDTQIY